jgi:hypothetical protein
MSLALFESEDVPFWLGGVVFFVLVSFGAVARQRVVRRAQRVDYTPL